MACVAGCGLSCGRAEAHWARQLGVSGGRPGRRGPRQFGPGRAPGWCRLRRPSRLGAGARRRGSSSRRGPRPTRLKVCSSRLTTGRRGCPQLTDQSHRSRNPDRLEEVGLRPAGRREQSRRVGLGLGWGWRSLCRRRAGGRMTITGAPYNPGKAGATGTSRRRGRTPRRAGTKPSWKVDPAQEGAVFSHL